MGFRWTAASRCKGGVTLVRHVVTLVLTPFLFMAVVVIRVAHIGQRTLSLWLQDHSAYHAVLVLKS